METKILVSAAKVLVGVAVVLVMAGCEESTTFATDWAIENRDIGTGTGGTKEDIVVYSALWNSLGNEGGMEIKKRSGEILYGATEFSQRSFETLISAWLALEEDPTFSIEYEGVITKTWRYSERNEPGRQFFNGKSWKKTQGISRHPYVSIVTYHFVLLPEDIVLPETEQEQE